MKKRNSPDFGRQQQTKTFQQFMLDQTLKKFKGYIDGEVGKVGQSVAQQQKELLESLYIRVRSLEEILVEKFDDVTKETLAERVAALEDKSENLEKVDIVKLGDKVRFEIKTKAEDQEEFQGSSRLQVDNVGSGQTIGKELEGFLIGMKTDEEKEVSFGKDGKMTAYLKVNRISRSIEKESQEDNKNEDSNESQ